MTESNETIAKSGDPGPDPVAMYTLLRVNRTLHYWFGMQLLLLVLLETQNEGK